MELKNYLYEIIEGELLDGVTLTKDLDCDLESVYDDIPDKHRVRDYLLKSGNYGKLILVENTGDYYDTNGSLPKTIDMKVEEVVDKVVDGKVKGLKLEHIVGRIDIRSGYITIKVYSNYIEFPFALMLMDDIVKLISTTCKCN